MHSWMKKNLYVVLIAWSAVGASVAKANYYAPQPMPGHAYQQPVTYTRVVTRETTYTPVYPVYPAYPAYGGAYGGFAGACWYNVCPRPFPPFVGGGCGGGFCGQRSSWGFFINIGGFGGGAFRFF